MPNVLVSKIIPRAKQLQQKEGISYNAALKKASAEYRAGKLPTAKNVGGSNKKAPKNVTGSNKKAAKKSKNDEDGLGDVLEADVRPLKLKRNK